jgi:hypothetical protein
VPSHLTDDTLLKVAVEASCGQGNRLLEYLILICRCCVTCRSQPRFALGRRGMRALSKASPQPL